MNSGNIYRHANRRGIYLVLWTDPEGDSCFRIYQISWTKIKKSIFFVNKRCHLVKSLLTLQLTVFLGSYFMILLQIHQENYLLNTSKHPQAKVRRFLGIFLYDCFIYRSNKCLKTRLHLGSDRKPVNSHSEYSELREPIKKTRENCYWLR